MKDKIVVVFSSHLSDDENSKFIKHVTNTIGVKHKVFCYKNLNEYSLSEIYNKSLKDHYEIDSVFVFCHNDIILKTMNWGKLLLGKFNNSNFNIIGVAGSSYLSDSGVWWDDRSKMFGIVEHTDGYKEWVSEFSKEINGIKEVVLIDGLFICVDPDTIIHKFDEDFKGFHYYDLGFSIPNYLDGCKIGVITTIRIMHKSVGMVNEEWDKNRIIFTEKYFFELPLSILPKYHNVNIKLTSTPKVSVIIPTKNNLKYILNNISSWDNVKYENYEIIIADTGSDGDVISGYDELLSDKIKLVRYDYYNFGKINNDVVKNHISADTEILLFCNDDVILINDVLSRCVDIYNNNIQNVGTIGIRLHFGNGNIQHCGIQIIRDISNNIHLTHVDLNKYENYFNGVEYNSLGNTGAFLMINKDLFFEIGEFNENYLECFEDVELNLMCLLKNKKNITVCDAVAYHYESISRNKSDKKLENLNKDYFERLQPFFLKNINILGDKIKLIN